MDAICSPHTCSVLVVDDDPSTGEVVGVALRAEGFTVLASRNGREALHILRSRAETCIILLDLQLPIMNGAQFRAAQLRDRSLAWIPVLVMSGVPGAQWEAERLGAAGFVHKPVNLDDLREQVARLRCRRLRAGVEHRAGRSAL